jgi:hypothetical protein
LALNVSKNPTIPVCFILVQWLSEYLEQKAYLLGKRYEAEKRKQAGAPDGNRNAQKQRDHNGPIVCENGGRTYERVAREAGVGFTTVKRAGQFARAIDTLAADSPTIIPPLWGFDFVCAAPQNGERQRALCACGAAFEESPQTGEIPPRPRARGAAGL